MRVNIDKSGLDAFQGDASDGMTAMEIAMQNAGKIRYTDVKFFIDTDARTSDQITNMDKGVNIALNIRNTKAKYLAQRDFQQVECLIFSQRCSNIGRIQSFI